MPACRPGSAAGRSPPYWPRQCRRSSVGLALLAHAQAPSAGLDLFRPGGGDRRLHPDPGEPGDGDHLRHHHRAVLAFSTVPPTSSLVMLMFGTKYMAMLTASPSSRIRSALGVLPAASCMSASAPTTSSGGSRWRSVSSWPGSTADGRRSRWRAHRPSRPDQTRTGAPLAGGGLAVNLIPLICIMLPSSWRKDVSPRLEGCPESVLEHPHAATRLLRMRAEPEASGVFP